MAKITYNPKKLKKDEVRISAGKPKKSAAKRANQAADTLGGMTEVAVDHIRSRGIVPGAKHRSD